MKLSVGKTRFALVTFATVLGVASAPFAEAQEKKTQHLGHHGR